MTVSANDRTISYTTSGTTYGPFSVPFEFFELRVYEDGVIVPNGNYTISQAVPGTTGTITFTSHQPDGEVLIVGKTVQQQQTDFISAVPPDAETVERGLDRLMMIAQELQKEVERSLRVPAPPSSETAYDALGKKIINGAPGVLSTDFATVGNITTALQGFTISVNTNAMLPTRTAIKALNTGEVTTAYLTEAGREGVFLWRLGNYSAHITADTTEGFYLKADAVASTVGAWVRVDSILNVRHFGAVADGVTSDRDAIQAALNVANTSGSPNRVHFPASKTHYRMLGSDAVLQGQGSVILSGDGPLATIVERDDFTDNSGVRRDVFRMATGVTGADLECRDMQFLGEWEKEYTTDTGTWTINYRIPGNIQLEGYVRADANGPGTNTRDVSTADIKLPDTASSINDFYRGCGIQIGAGTGVGTDAEITAYNGTTKVATINRTITGGSATTSDSYIQIGGYAVDPAIGGRDDASTMVDTVSNLATGFGFNLDDMGDVIFKNVELRGIRNQALSIDNARSVMVQGCHLYKCARGGISIRNTPNVSVTGNILRFIADDAIFNSQTSPSSSDPGDTANTLIAHNVLIDTFGIRALGAHRMSITDNLLVRTMTKGIAVGPVDDNKKHNIVSLQIKGNYIFDMLDRNAIVYNSPSSAAERPAGIEVFAGQGGTSHDGAADPLNLPGQWNGTNAVNKPETAMWALSTRTPGTGIVISDNHVGSYMKLQADFSDYNADLDDNGGGGAFYHRGTLLTNGFVNPVGGITGDHIDFYPIKMVGPLHDCDISRNTLSGRATYAGIYFAGDDTDGDTGLGADIQFDYALTKVSVRHNKISRVSHGIRFESDGVARTYDVDIDGNIIDGDPYFESTLRKTGPIDGTWTSSTHYGIDNDEVYGLNITRNVFSNIPRPVRSDTNCFLMHNLVYARASAVASNDENAGVRHIPSSAGGEWIVIDRDSNPLSADFLKTGGSTVTQANAKPSSGRYVAGHIVWHQDGGVDVDGTLIVGWYRLTTGSTHVLNTDWAEIVVYSRDETNTGTVTYAQIVTTGTKHAANGSDSFTYDWSRRGNVVSGNLRISWGDTTTGPPAPTQIAIAFASMGLPSPRDPAGVTTGAQQVVVPVSVVAAQALSGTTNAVRGYIRKEADDSYMLVMDTTPAAWKIQAFQFNYECV